METAFNITGDVPADYKFEIEVFVNKSAGVMKISASDMSGSIWSDLSDLYNAYGRLSLGWLPESYQSHKIKFVWKNQDEMETEGSIEWGDTAIYDAEVNYECDLNGDGVVDIADVVAWHDINPV